MSPRVKLALLGAACAAPFVLSTLVWLMGWGVGQGGNYGELLAPQTLSQPPFDALRGKWLLVSFDGSACPEPCAQKLYFMRQSRRAQGKEMDRIERVWILTDGGSPRAELQPLVEGVRVLPPVDAAMLKRFEGAPADHIYVVDPLGNLMMRFPANPDPSLIIKDLKRLMRVSRVG